MQRRGFRNRHHRACAGLFGTGSGYLARPNLWRVRIEVSIECRTRKCARQPAAWLATRARNPEENDGLPACCFCCQPCLSFLTTRSIPDAGEIGGSTQGHLAEFLRRELSAFSFSLFNEPYLFTPPHWRRISTE